MAQVEPGERERQIYRLFAFLGRYAHQDMASMWNATVRDLHGIAQQTNELIKEERGSSQFDDLATGG
jgi:hypothetical protein